MNAATVKLLVWECDNTLWDGVVCDSTAGALRAEAARSLRILNQRGVMHAVASRGEWAWTVEQLRRHGVAERFAAVDRDRNVGRRAGGPGSDARVEIEANGPRLPTFRASGGGDQQRAGFPGWRAVTILRK